jgi:glycerol-3-phosphate dehydrogenase
MNTIAIIGAEITDAVKLAALAANNNSLLLFSKPENDTNLLREKILQIYPTAEVESFACSRDACWEADDILLLIPLEELQSVANQFRDVATQKQIGFYSDKGLSAGELKKQFPYSVIVDLNREKFPNENNEPQNLYINDQI